MSRNIKIYSKAGCAQCQATKMWLDDAGKGYTELRVDTDEVALNEVKALGFSGLPVVVADGVEPFQGFRPDVLDSL